MPFDVVWPDVSHSGWPGQGHQSPFAAGWAWYSLTGPDRVTPDALVVRPCGVDRVTQPPLVVERLPICQTGSAGFGHGFGPGVGQGHHLGEVTPPIISPTRGPIENRSAPR